MNPLRRWVLAIVRAEMRRQDAANAAHVRNAGRPAAIKR